MRTPVRSPQATGTVATSRATRPFRWFTPLLAVLLGGYMFFGRPFAYLSLPGAPAYIGDMVLAVGVVEAVRARSAIRAALAASPPLRFLLAFMVVCGLRFLVGFPTYGLDAVRDSAIWYYGIFAFLVAGAAVCDPTFTPRLFNWYRRILPVFLAWAPIAVVLSRLPPLGFVPGTVTAINGFVPGDIALHTAIAIAFLWLGLDRAVGRSPSRPSSQLLVPLGLVGFLAAGTQNRGGFLAGLCVLAVVLCCIRSGGRRRALVSGACSLAVVTLLVLLLDVRIPLKDRELSLQQIGANVSSILDPDSGDASDSGNLQGNVDWRLQYWDAVKQDALSPSYILNGRGFGPILAFEYGIDAPREDGTAPLRSAHNTHLTILARTGLPGAALWVLLWLVWFRHVVRWGVRGVRRGWTASAALSALVLAAVVGYLVNTYFDPALDGPKGAIWIWSLMALGAVYAAKSRSAELNNRGASHGGRPSKLARSTR
jgi:hypothetical protein